MEFGYAKINLRREALRNLLFNFILPCVILSGAPDSADSERGLSFDRRGYWQS
jgi:hypothetical protein